jgi:hypothetical protein
MISGGCLCGAVRYEIDADKHEDDASYCHCSMCRRWTGSAFSVSVRAPSALLRWTGAAPKRYRSSSIAWRAFCGECGSPIYFQFVDKPEYYALSVGSLDRPEDVKPADHWGIESRIAWVKIVDGLPQHETPE